MKLEKLCTASNKAFLCINSHIVTFSWLNSHMWQRLAAKWSAKHLRFSWWHINLPLWTKQQNILLSSGRSGYLFSIGSMKDKQSLKCRRRKQSGREKLRSFAPDPSPHFLACLVTMLRGGVTGRLPFGFFFSAGFKIYRKWIERWHHTAVKHSWREVFFMQVHKC